MLLNVCSIILTQSIRFKDSPFSKNSLLLFLERSTIPTNPEMHGFLDFRLWKNIVNGKGPGGGGEILVTSNINNWVRCDCTSKPKMLIDYSQCQKTKPWAFLLSLCNLVSLQITKKHKFSPIFRGQLQSFLQYKSTKVKRTLSFFFLIWLTAAPFSEGNLPNWTEGQLECEVVHKVVPCPDDVSYRAPNKLFMKPNGPALKCK